jgi:2-phospho-L-lactate guanylyltransferase
MLPEAEDNMSRTFPVFAILPVKGFDQAKSRLASLLRPSERADLARTMFADVLASLGKAENLVQTMVVTEDSSVAAMAGASGAAVVASGGTDGINVAVNTAIEKLPAATPCGIIVVPADIPHIEPRHVEMLAGLIAARSAVVLVPASRDDGTNILAFSPHDLMRPSFGKSSFLRHVASARGAGINPDICRLDRLDLDLDVPGDLLQFLSLKSKTRTHAFLSGLNLEERWRGARRSALRSTWHSRQGNLPDATDALAEVSQ